MCLTVPPSRRLTAIEGVHLHRATLHECVRLQGVDATPPARSVLDLGREDGWRAGVVAADAALNRQLVTIDELQDAARIMKGWPYSRRAERVMELCDGRAESPLESLSRIIIDQHDLPATRPQVCLGDANRRFVGRVDFYWDKFGVVGEADGLTKYTDHAILLAEKRRQENLEELGLIVVRWGWSDLKHFDRVADRLRRAFARSVRGTQAERWCELPSFVRGDVAI